MPFSFKELRENITPKSIIVKKYTLEGKEVVISKEETAYSITIDGKLLSDDFDNQVEAEEAAAGFLELLGEQENVDEKKWTAKDKKKRLDMIRKAVQKIDARNLAKAKRDALAMMKDSGMFDEEIKEQEKT